MHLVLVPLTKNHEICEEKKMKNFICYIKKKSADWGGIAFSTSKRAPQRTRTKEGFGLSKESSHPGSQSGGLMQMKDSNMFSSDW